MRVSAVVPARLPAPYLAEALDSLRSQTRPLDEILLVAHGWSPDPADPAFQDVRVIEAQSTASLSEVRNAGLRAATGEWVLLLDADDVALPTRLAQELTALEATPSAVLVAGAIELMDSHGASLGHAFVRDAGPVPASALLRRNHFAQSTVLLNRQVALSAGGYADLRMSEDYELWLRMRSHGDCIYVNEVLTKYRIHEAQMTSGLRVPRSAWRSIRGSRTYLAKSAGVPVWHALVAHLAWVSIQAMPRTLGPRRYAARWPEATRVMVTGGLGNQMFQMAAALDLAHGSRVELIPDLGAPRRHDGVHSDIEALALPQNAQIARLTKLPLLFAIARKASGYMLRIGVIGSRVERTKVFRAIASIGASLILLPVLGAWTRVRGAVGVGFDPIAMLPSTNPLLLGYFQTWRHVMAPHVLPAMRCALADVGEPWYSEMRAIAADERPIVVHVRLGDYRKEPGLGLISTEYYAAAIVAARESLPYSRLWLFSDEPEAALAMLPAHEALASPRIVDPPTPQTHPAELMRVMSLGTRFVLGNSTFGWWAAMLSESKGAVCVPSPWFAIGEQPRELLPSHWTRRSRDTGEVLA